ncbi:MAG: hypothetical protein ACUVR0_09405 [Candidatus Aminicenantales bacterium]
MTWTRKVKGLGVILFFIGLGIHFHHPEALNNFHIHDLTVTVTSYSPAHILSDGHICPCFVATLDMPIMKAQYIINLYQARLESLFLFNTPFSLTWKIFHPPQPV